MTSPHAFSPLTASEKQMTTTTIDTWTAITPISTSVLPPPQAHPKQGRPSQQWIYTDAQGQALCFIYRFDNTVDSNTAASANKWFLPLTFCKNNQGKQAWRWQALPTPRPLYHLAALSQHPQKPVLICEGEKDADAAAILFPDWITTTCLNGARAVKKTDWQPLIGREVMIWPDNDATGLQFAKTVSQHLFSLDHTQLKVLKVPLTVGADCVNEQAILSQRSIPLANGWGAADAIADGWTPAHAQLLRTADDHWQHIENNPTATSNKPAKKSQVQQLTALLTPLDVFHSYDKKTYVTHRQATRTEHVAIDSQSFKHWLALQYFTQYQQSPNSHSMTTALNAFKGRALFASPCHPIYTRIAQYEDIIYINLANELGQSIAVNHQGWKIVTEVPVKFCHTPMMRALPQPVRGGSLQTLWSYLNIPNEQDRKLLLVWLIECFRTHTPFPILLLQGEQGSAKSTTQQRLRALIDPSHIDLRTAPHKIRDIFINAANNWCVSYNNLSHLSTKEQDAFCALATGGGYAVRKLFTNTEETAIEIKRPVILNGISGLATAQDFIDRCLTVALPIITKQQRKTETELNTAFAQVYPQLFGALLDLLVSVLKLLPTVKLAEKPRMADFALLGVATETALGWPQGSFMQAYQVKYQQASLEGLEASPIIQALLSYLTIHPNGYSGTYARLLKLLTPQQLIINYHWPRSAKGLADALKRQIGVLRSLGVRIYVDPQRHNDGYHISITQTVSSAASKQA